MKLIDRTKFKQVVLIGMSNPQTRVNKEGKVVPVLQGINEAGFQQMWDCDPKIFDLYNGSNISNRPADGLDFRKDTTFVVYVDDSKELEAPMVRSIDILPNKMLKGRTIPASMVDVDTLKIRCMENGCMEVIQRPYNTRVPLMRSVIDAMNKHNDDIIPGTVLQQGVRVVDVRDRDVEISTVTAGGGERVY